MVAKSRKEGMNGQSPQLTLCCLMLCLSEFLESSTLREPYCKAWTVGILNATHEPV